MRLEKYNCGVSKLDKDKREIAGYTIERKKFSYHMYPVDTKTHICRTCIEKIKNVPEEILADWIDS